MTCTLMVAVVSGAEGVGGHRTTTGVGGHVSVHGALGRYRFHLAAIRHFRLLRSQYTSDPLVSCGEQPLNNPASADLRTSGGWSSIVKRVGRPSLVF